MPTGFLWGSTLIVTMLIMFYKTVTQSTETAGAGPSGVAPPDD